MTNQFFYRILCGFFLGLSVFLPGLSGSVIAIIMGIYQDILRIVSNPFKKLKENIVFCVPLAIGVGISAILFVVVFSYLFETYEKAAYLLFVGLIAGNLPVIYSEIKKYEFKKRYLSGGAVAFIMVLIIGFLATENRQTSGIENIGLPILMISGFFAGVVALVPGMSVSSILIIFGVYSQLLFIAETLLRSSINYLIHFFVTDTLLINFNYLIHFAFFGAFAVAGLVLAAGSIKAAFEKHPGFANVTVFGFMSGSLIGILIQSLSMYDSNFSWLFGGAMLAAGLAISMLFVVLGKTMNK